MLWSDRVHSLSEMLTAPSLKIFFPGKLYELVVSSPPHIIDWTPDGGSFAILDKDLLCSSVLPQFFRHDRFESFQRQLNLCVRRARDSARHGWMRGAHNSWEG